jgi:hypothetical protein
MIATHFGFKAVHVLVCVLIGPGNADSLDADLHERHASLVTTKGPAEANRWYRRQIVTSIAPLFWAQLKRAFGIARIVDYIQRKRS